ncbi:MAG TPA: hypothetical protein VM938_08060 [Acidimicrobiales bacterium]|nr:hypothetical protein [Acidimicrobiales bacterium]
MSTSLPGAVARAGAAALFGALTAGRRKRVFHPVGGGFEATFNPVAGAFDAPLFADGEPRRAVVRMSKGIGLPGRLPDVLGFAVKILEPEQDFLLVTSGSAPGARHLLWPAADACARPYSSILFFRAGCETVVFGGELTEERTFRLTAATATGPWRAAGFVELHDPLPDEVSQELHFNPANSGGGIEPVGPLNRLRDAAYRASQRARAEHQTTTTG